MLAHYLPFTISSLTPSMCTLNHCSPMVVLISLVGIRPIPYTCSQLVTLVTITCTYSHASPPGCTLQLVCRLPILVDRSNSQFVPILYCSSILVTCTTVSVTALTNNILMFIVMNHSVISSTYAVCSRRSHVSSNRLSRNLKNTHLEI